MKKIVRLWMLLVLALTLGLAISVTTSADAPAIGGKSQWKVGDTITFDSHTYYFNKVNADDSSNNVVTKEKSERVSTVYAGEIFVDGESKMTWLYSTDLSNSEIVFQRLRECLSQTAFDGLVPAMTGETAAKGLAVSSDHQSEMGSGWKSAATVAGQYFTGTVGSEKSGNFYDENAVYKTAVDAHYAERKETYDTPLGFNKTIGSALSTTTDFVWENHDGVLIKKYTVTAKVEETTVIYTTVNVTTEPQSANVKTAPTANTLTYTGSAQELVTAGEATGGTMHYALGTNAATVPTTGWSTSVPTGTDAGTYYVWYKVKGDSNHTDSTPAFIKVTIAEKQKETPKEETPKKETPKKETPDNPKDEATPAKMQANASVQLNAGFQVYWKGSTACVKWGNAPEADQFEIYAQYCGSKACKKILTVKSGNSASFNKLNGKKLNRKRVVKAYVVAIKNGKEIGRTLLGHAAGSKNSRTNAKRVKVSKKTYTLTVGKSAKIKAKIVNEKRRKKLLRKNHCAKLRYTSSDPKVATVSKSGKIKAVGKGKCDIRVHAQNGRSCKITVTVK